MVLLVPEFVPQPVPMSMEWTARVGTEREFGWHAGSRAVLVNWVESTVVVRPPPAEPASFHRLAIRSLVGAIRERLVPY